MFRNQVSEFVMFSGFEFVFGYCYYYLGDYTTVIITNYVFKLFLFFTK